MRKEKETRSLMERVDRWAATDGAAWAASVLFCLLMAAAALLG